MALAALQARIAAREEMRRMEAERLEEQRVKQEKVAKFKRDLVDFEEELRRFENDEDDDNINGIEESKDKTNDMVPATNDSPQEQPPSLTIRDSEAAYREIEAREESDVEDYMPDIDVAKTEFQQRTTKRALEIEAGEALKRQKRHEEMMGSYENRFDAVAEEEKVHTGDDVGLLYQPEGDAEGMDVDSGVDSTSITPNDDHTPIKVLIGSTTAREEFSLPKTDLTKHSTYFASLLSFEPIDEDEEQIIILPDVSPELFTLFANFLRFGKVLSNRPEDFTLRSSPDDGYHIDKGWTRLAEAWHLGERLQSVSFQDAIVDALAMKVSHSHAWPIDMYKSFYTPSTPGTRGIKTLLIDLALCFWGVSTLNLPELQEGGEFFQEILDKREELEEKAMRGESVEMRVLELGCEYHDHGVGRVCYREGVPDLWVTGGGLEREGKGEVWGGGMWSDDEDDDEEFIEIKQEKVDEEMDGVVKQQEVKREKPEGTDAKVKQEKVDGKIKEEAVDVDVKPNETDDVVKQEEMDLDVKSEEPVERIKKEEKDVEVKKEGMDE
ncbi:hypothetical protein PRZ48_000664 [Zasmidium cellare]|uniref:BTB domain-containing protein n=1 Tax=Zasmidium cellare TaxID=395010 RepID=A0ABR0F0P3_ZASCE|nr:hypothetical protein PRZ48_000664 [Zasmidium cellare]